MRIRTQLMASAAVAAGVAVLIAVGLVGVTRQAQTGLDEQAESQQVSRHVANMLSLTNEFAVFGAERAAAQWRIRHAQLSDAVQQARRRHDPPAPEVQELQRHVDDLPGIFDRLVQIADAPPSPLNERRRELLLERLLTQTQEVVESRHRWALAIGGEQQAAQRRYTAMVVAAPALLLVLLVSLGVLIARRVLRPLGRLQRAAEAIRGGDLRARCANDANDELGDAARAVESMAMALQQQSAALKAATQRLRLITDHLPAFVGHIDTEERYTFVNAHFLRTDRRQPDEVLGHTLREVRGDAVYALIAPHVARALRGETVSFETTRTVDGAASHRQSTYVPELDTVGRVKGFYAMTFDITARKAAELRLAASERLLKNITDNVPALVAYIDRDHRYCFANSRYRDWLGADESAMVGQHVRDAVSEEFFGLIRPHLDTALGGERTRWERRASRGGKEVHYLAEYIPDLGADGSVRGCYALTIDITERREAELAAAKSEQRMHDLTNSIPAMVGYFDMDERCQYANEVGLHSQGLERADIPGITLREVLGEVNYAQHEPYVKQALDGRRARLQGKIGFEGREAHFQAHLIPDRVESGKQRGFYLMTFDITALKEAQNRQEQVERQLRGITDNLPVLITHIDRSGHYTFVNATCKTWVGIEPAALIGRAFSDDMTPANHEQRREYLARAMAGERVEFSVESQALGVTRSLQNIYIPDLQSDGSVSGVITLSTDVTAMKRIETELSRLARVDGLTGLPNRRQLEEKLAESITRASRQHRALALMFLDIDHFKAINDTLGHAGGDTVLKEFARRLRAAVRSTDTPARLAGDEFVVVLEALHGLGDAELVAEKIIAAIRKPFIVDGMPLRVTTSIGVAFCDRPGPQSPMMDCADAALYDAKDAGRNTFRLRSIDSFVSAFGAFVD